MTDLETDILIIGGGLVGSALMLALRDTSFRIHLVESKPMVHERDSDFDARNLALSEATIRILNMLSLWPQLRPNACPIQTIHVSEEKAFCSTLLESKHEQSPLGYVVEMQHIQTVLQQNLDASSILSSCQLLAWDGESAIATLQKGSETVRVKTKLLVAADGTHSCVRRLCGLTTQVKDYVHHALIANVALQRDHQFVAYERFLSDGSLAFLPMTGLRTAMVWSLPSERAKQMLALEEKDFLTLLQKRFGYRLGRFTAIGKRQIFPLRHLLTEKQQSLENVVFIGNAAQTLHPIAGQGFNLGLRDAAMLAQCITQKGLCSRLPHEYYALRKQDLTTTTSLTHGLVQLFLSKTPGVGFARRVGLLAFENIPPLKHCLQRYASGFSGVLPDLVCNIPLTEAKSHALD